MLQRIITICIFLLLAVNSQADPNNKNPAPTHNDLIIGLVDGLGWSFGLPDEPEVSDYLTILAGRKTWRFEIEDIYVPSARAPLAPKEILSFGRFSGKFWQRAPGRNIDAELSFLLPLSGSYEIRAALTKPGYKFRMNETELSADGERNFSEVSFGSVELSAGAQRAEIGIPSRGGIDYLLLEAPPASSIEPLAGWSAEKKLDSSDLAVVIARTLDLEPFLMPAASEITIEAEEAPTPNNSILSDDRYQGPMQGQWLKAGMRMATYSHLFEIQQAGIYDLYLNILGRGPVNGYLNGKDHFTITPKPYFTTIYAGSFYLDKDTNQLELDLPSRAGFDRFILKPRASTPTDYRRLTGLSSGSITTTDQLDQILRLIATIGVQHR